VSAESNKRKGKGRSIQHIKKEDRRDYQRNREGNEKRYISKEIGNKKEDNRNA
jgi:hypothetical protein